MNRLDEVRLGTVSMEEPARALFRAALVALVQGRLDAAAAAVRDPVSRGPVLRWLALLLALESVELRHGGALQVETPRSVFARDANGLMTETWDVFALKLWPSEEVLRVQLRWDRSLLVLAHAPANERTWVALDALRVEVAQFLGVAVVYAELPGE